MLWSEPWAVCSGTRLFFSYSFEVIRHVSRHRRDCYTCQCQDKLSEFDKASMVSVFFKELWMEPLCCWHPWVFSHNSMPQSGLSRGTYFRKSSICDYFIFDRITCKPSIRAVWLFKKKSETEFLNSWERESSCSFPEALLCLFVKFIAKYHFLNLKPENDN